MDKIPLIDLDSGDNNRDPQVTPQLVFLDTNEEAEKVNQETPFPPENPGGEPTEKSVEPIAMAEAENQQLDPDLINKKTETVRYSREESVISGEITALEETA